ncbi:MAG: 1-(5-phosphoribosyl)-5-[(5-phosphoribosylamino)methylideneamino]imidazole-4-carboxamide isomerase [Spirochaeta sp.]|nr:1-(5-phosphoribosyl)-5-[(5-phosphoribosylamino)methylideneamino]imidazole-4-carboxamide isomerase [Spirochaeta sp.]
MILIPSIDILGGKCVRLLQGDFEESTIYDKDPVAVAREFEAAGARRIHLVDLDAARGDSGMNRGKIRKIRRAVKCTLQLGGGIRSEDDIEELLDIGIDRFVVGTAFARRPQIVEGWTGHYGSIFLAGIDARDGKVQISGWEEDSGIEDITLAKRARELGACGIIYTNIEKDGALQGPDIARTNLIAESCGLPVILSGGIASAEDVERVAGEGHKSIVGVIAGRAIYEGKLDPAAFFAKQPAALEETSW